MVETLRLTPDEALTLLVERAAALTERVDGRVALGIAGGPGVGKSTLAARLVERLNAAHPGEAALVPMDGFHIRHAELEAMGQTDRKGAPHTFEAAAFVDFLGRLKRSMEPMTGPGYSRKIEDVVDDAFTVAPSVRVLVVEGNYLLLESTEWAGVRPLLEFAAFLEVPRELVRARLLARHGAEGLFTPERNIAHVERNDLPNYDLVMATAGRADVAIALKVPQ
ncbi:nucleoside/nucleotide kinase family protein [Nostoc sp. 3335mG]|nr:nucleoside/nucleotide kinase family protein [Nostoc sp. 3335mG]